jgi:hypothetical protein
MIPATFLLNPLASPLNQDQQQYDTTDACDQPDQINIVHVSLFSFLSKR